jgi:hypothetical protein
MVATQQVWENHDMGALGKEGKLWFDLLEVVVASYAQKLFSSRRDIEHTTESTLVA